MPPGAREASASLELAGISKHFGSLRALDGAGLRLFPGEIHALLGENGAGKSTLVSIAAGHLSPDAGSVSVDGEAVRFRSPREARRLGVALVPQHDLLAEAVTVADNLSLLDLSAPFFETRGARRARVERLSRLGLELGPPDAPVAGLPVATRQRIEIAGALSGDPSILILDEPTAVLSPDERTALFAALRARAASGRSILLITHRLAEVFEAADRLTVLARGRTVLESPVAATSADAVAALLLAGAGLSGAELPKGTDRPQQALAPGPAALDVAGLLPFGLSAPVSLALRPGEQLTLLAIDGNGADRIASAIAGVHPALGTVSIHGRAVPTTSPRAFRAAGGAFVPADRRAEGIVASMSLAENLALSGRAGRFLLGPARLAREAQARIGRFGIRGEPGSRAGSLSGGNQQKLVLARELEPVPRVLVAIHPTRGLDIASAADVLRRIASARARGAAVLVVTADPDETRSLGGTVRVVYRGVLSPPFAPDTDPLLLGKRMAGLAA